MDFPEAFVEVLCHLHSDHNPILLRLGGLPQMRGPYPFRFEAEWIAHDNYSHLVEIVWLESNNNPVVALAKVRDESIIFNREGFGNIFKRKHNI